MSEQPNEVPPPPEPEQSPRADAASSPTVKRLGSIVIGCVGLIFLVWTVSMIVFSIIGLTTGYLYLPPGRGGKEIELHGMWARIVSLIILLFFSFITFLLIRNSRKRRKPKILGD